MRKTITISVPEEMYSFIFERSRSRFYGAVSEYIRSLVREDQFRCRDNRVVKQNFARPRKANDFLGHADEEA